MGQTPIFKCPTDFPLILWHPYARHYYFCVMTGKEQEKWRAVFQDCVRHCNNGEGCWEAMAGGKHPPAPTTPHGGWFGFGAKGDDLSIIEHLLVSVSEGGEREGS